MRFALEIESIMQLKAALRPIDAEAFDPKIHNKVDITTDFGRYLMSLHPKGKIIVSGNIPPADEIAKLAEEILKCGLKDKSYINTVCSGMVLGGGLKRAKFEVKCYSYGQHILSNNTLNHMARGHAGHDFRLWAHEYVKSATDILADHYNDIRPIRGQPREPSEKTEALILKQLMSIVDRGDISFPEKYSRLVAFNYVAEGLRKEGFGISPAIMPKFMTDALEQRLQAEFGWRQK